MQFQDRLLLLKKCLAMTSLVVLTLFSLPAKAQNPIRIVGHVTNDNGQPLSRASVVVKGLHIGVACDSSGNFAITAPGHATLIISSVGYTDRKSVV